MTHIQTGDQDFSAQIPALKAQHPDLIYAPNYYAEDALWPSSSKTWGLIPPSSRATGPRWPELLSIGGPAVNGMYFTAHFHRPGGYTPWPKFGRLTKDQQKTTGRLHRPGRGFLFSLAEAITKAGSLEGPKIAQALAETKDFPGVTGTISMGPDHNPIKGVTIIKVENGKFVYQTTIKP